MRDIPLKYQPNKMREKKKSQVFLKIPASLVRGSVSMGKIICTYIYYIDAFLESTIYADETPV